MKLYFKNNRPLSRYAAIGGVVFFVFSIITFYRIFSFPRVDSPSSTDSIAYVFAFIYSVLISIGGSICGIAIGKTIEFLTSRLSKGSKRFFISSLLLLISMLFLSYFISTACFEIAVKQSDEWNKQNSLGVKLDRGVIERVNIKKIKVHLDKYDLKLNYKHVIGYIGGEHFKSVNQFVWNEKLRSIYFDKTNKIFIKDDDDTILIEHNLSGYNYIIGISYIIYPLNTKDCYLFILSRLRATSRQSLLSVFNSSAALVYEELIEASNIIEIVETNEKEKVIIIGNIQPVYNKEPYVYLHDFYYRLKTN